MNYVKECDALVYVVPVHNWISSGMHYHLYKYLF